MIVDILSADMMEEWCRVAKLDSVPPYGATWEYVDEQGWIWRYSIASQ